MSEDPQVVSISSSPPLSPDEIARKSFPAVRRGVDGEAVRIFLGKVAAELREAVEREAVLRLRVVEAERRAEDPELDEATLTRAIGVETAKILWTAHDAAKNVVTTAEERAAELLAEAEHVLEDQTAAAETESRAIRQAAEEEGAELTRLAQSEADSLTDGAQADAVELLDATKEECRRMVAEARELRTRTLADLAARRRTLHIQLEELRTGKDSLLRVVDDVAVSVEELRDRLASAEDAARVAAEEAGHRVAQEPDHDDLVELEAELVAAGEAQAQGGTVAAPGEESSVEGEPDQEVATASKRSVDELFARIRASRAAEESVYDIEAVTAAEADVANAAGVANAETGDVPAAPEEADAETEDQDEHPEAANEPEPAADVTEVAAEHAGGNEPDAEGAPSVEAGETGDVPRITEQIGADSGDITQLIEIVQVEAVATGAAEEAAAEGPIEDESITEPDVEALARRDHLLGTITAKLGRTLKRALQDDQNDLLNALRQASGKPVLDDLIPPNVQLERFATAAEEPLARAFEAGAAFLVAGDSVEGPSVTAPAPTEMAAFEAGTLLAAELADDLSSQLRLKIEEALTELDGALEGSADAAGSAYREWKGSRVEGLAGDFATRAFAFGELAVLGSLGEGEAPFVRWVVEDDDAGGSCPDCDDNSLAGPLPSGAEFPTGHVRPPVHPGCRCLLVPVRS